MISLSYLSNSVLLLCKSNTTRSKRKKQDRIRKYFEPIPKVRQNITEYVSKLSPKKRKVLAAIVDLEGKYEHVYATQDTIAAMAGCSRKHASETIRELEDVQIIAIENRGYISNRTKLSPWFRNNKITFKLGQLVYAFFAIGMLMPTPISNGVTRKENESIYIKYSYMNNRDTLERLSQIAKERRENTLKGEIPNQRNLESPPQEEVILRKIAKLFNNDMEMVIKLRPEAIAAILKNRPEILSS